MKATGIVRRIDDLGRVVIPKEIRRTMRIREGDPLEIYTDSDGEVIFKKYSPIGEMANTANQYADVLNRCGSMPVIVCDRDQVVAAAGISKREVLERRISANLEDLMERRVAYKASSTASKLVPIEGIEKNAMVMYPIIASGDVTGCVLLVENENSSMPNDSDVKLVRVAAEFLGKQME